MPHEPSFDPENRALYGDILRAPAGFAFDCGVATTFSMDFETALVVSATLAFNAAETRDETLDSPIALLEGLERTAGRLAIFAEAGRIAGAPSGVSRLAALLEDTVVEVSAPQGGSFHPKIWALRFTPLGGEGPPRLRLAILSRNLTRDVSWDLALSLDGVPGQAEDARNAPICRLLRALPGLAEGKPCSDRATDIAESIADDIATAAWQRPEGVETLDFAVNGLGGPVWRPQIGRSLAVVAPFCDDGALAALVGRVPSERAFLVGRADELASLGPKTLARFGSVRVLDDKAETADGEDTGGVEDHMAPARGLHAKAFITERHSQTAITMGSGNATGPALVSGRNVEVFATLGGPSRRLGTVEEHMSHDSLGRLLSPFDPGATPPSEGASEAKETVEHARRALAGAGLVIACTEAASAGDRVLSLRAARAPDLPAGTILHVWPVVLGEAHAVPATALADGSTIGLGVLALRDVTRWLGLRLTGEDSNATLVFSLGAELEGLPEDRDTAILRSIIENREAFLRYLRLLLSGLADPGLLLQGPGAGGAWVLDREADADAPILEDMVKALTGDPCHLDDIARLVDRLGGAVGADAVIPPEFLDLWSAFEAVRQDGGYP